MRQIDVPSEWQRMPIKNVYLGMYDGVHGTPPESHTGPVFLGIKNLTDDGKLDFSDVRHISEGDFSRWTKRILPREGDIVFTYEATLHRYAIIPRGFRGCLGRRLALIRPDNSKIDTKYLFYFFFTTEWRNTIDKNTFTGATVDRIPIIHFPNFEITVPPLSTQHAIARILGSLDDKIELNRQMNETLEAMARSIFQSWFVDFDPVRAKAEGRETGLPPEIAALFPDGFEEIEGREVPRGWRVGRLDELMLLQRGFDLPKTQIEDGPYPVVCAGGIIGKHNKFMAKGPGITTGRSGVIGKVFFIQEDFWPHNTSLWVREFNISKPHHAFFVLQNLDLNIFNAGSAVATLNRNHIHNLPVLIPSAKVIDKFESVVQPLFELLNHNEQQFRTLAQIRDELLPKLMSGEVNISARDIISNEAL